MTTNSDAIDALTRQILGQNTQSKWQGQGFGSAEANAQDMAKILANIGITDIKDFGQVKEYVPVTVQTGEDGKPVYGTIETRYIGSDGDTSEQYFQPLADPSSVTFKNGEPVVATGGMRYGNKATGEAVPNTYGERQTDNAWGGTYAGKGNTAYRVKFDNQGNPIFYTTGATSNSLATMTQDSPMLGMVLNAAAAYFGGPVGVAALQAASGKDLEEIAKAAALAYVAGQVGNVVSGADGVADALGTTGANIAGKVAGSVATGGGAEGAKRALISGGLGMAKNAFADGPNSADMIEGYFLPGGEGYFDANAANAGMSGSGYYDEITGEYINDKLGGLQNPLDNSSGTRDPNLPWEYNQISKDVWQNADGNTIDLSDNPSSQEVLTGQQIMDRAGASGNSTTKTSGAKAGTTTKTANAAGGTDLSQLLDLLSSQGQSTTPPAVQENSADVQLMEEIFGPRLFTQAGTEGKRRFSQGGDVDTLLQILRG